MRKRIIQWLLGTALLLFSFPLSAQEQEVLPTTPRADRFMSRAKPRVERELEKKGLRLGAPVFIRIFKLSSELEVWMQQGNRFELFKTYPICSYSGYVGPKLREGDWQSPEGFYTISGNQMNPTSNFHLSFNIGYPNSFDASNRRTGSAIMVHGQCISQGCFAMGNRQIEEIYLLAYQAFLRGQERFSLHIFPFRMTKDNLDKYRDSPWFDFWADLGKGFTAFEQEHRVPIITSEQGRYIIHASPQRLAMKK